MPLFEADLGLGQIDPIGGFVGRALKAGDIYKSLSLAQSVAIELLPILEKIFQNYDQNLGNKVFDLNPRRNQGANIICEQVQILALCVLILADKLISGSDELPGLTAPGQTGNNLIDERGRLAEVFFQHLGASQIVISQEDILPEFICIT